MTGAGLIRGTDADLFQSPAARSGMSYDTKQAWARLQQCRRCERWFYFTDWQTSEVCAPCR